MRYLDPKADLTFKRVFGEHPDLVISFLNALLPLSDDEQIENVEYLPSELVPDNPMKKNSIVDVRCRDQRNRQFIVEMQMIWSSEFEQRVLFNASKAYVRQLEKREDYSLLQPVYSLNLVNEIFEPDMAEYYHDYRLVHEQHSERVIEGLRLVFIELPKYSPKTHLEKRMKDLWLRFLTEIDEHTIEVPEEMRKDAAISKALATLEESAYTDAQMVSYEKFWDIIRTERTLLNSAERRGLIQGRQEGEEIGIKKGLFQGRQEGEEIGIKKGEEIGIKKGEEIGIKKGEEIGIKKGLLTVAATMRQMGKTDEEIKTLTGLSDSDLSAL